MASVLKRWNGSEWVPVTQIIHMINGSVYPPGIYGTVGEPLIVELDLDVSDCAIPEVNDIDVTVELLTDVEVTQELDLSVSDILISGISEPTITIQLL